ncbi:RidA family protein [Novosphingobium sp.]|jgi:enamine deaminase RidA (YjgF/YER057c/UK114 family)|uniref:RidA family protein n=1 Tax=Novosphingobium sp. TaxID=1874826 RepID=UPI001EC0A0B5|nr:RidA family protein [Novosphingobium sp.]MBK6802632.1 RidA family protein [Novosphingobium sp.]MBK9012515.1 RidA family protein [Novosphingobium sp.]
MRILQPATWPRPRGYSNGIVARGEMIFLSGIIGWDEQERVAQGFVAQFRQAMENILTLLAEAHSGPQHVVRMTWYVTSRETYLQHARELGQIYRELFGQSYPAMAVVQVVALVEAAAEIEIEVTAVKPD